MFKKIFVLIALGVHLFSAEYNVYAWGYGDLLAETLQSIAYLFHFDGYKDAWKIMLELGLFISAMASIVPGSDIWKLPKLFLISTAVWGAFVTATTSIKIEDIKNPSYNTVINNVPWAVGYPMSLISTLEKELGSAYEAATSIPANLQYSNSGMAMPLNMSNASRSFKIQDATLSTNVREYVFECAAPDFWMGLKSFGTLQDSQDVWAYMGGTNPAVLVEYKNAAGITTVVSCEQAYNSITADMVNYFSIGGVGMQQMAEMNGYTSSATVAARLGESEQWLHDATLNASSILKQDAAIYSVNDAFKTYASMNGQTSTDIAQYIGKAESTASSNMLISGVLGSKYIPATKGILMSIVAGLTPLLALAMLTPMAMKSFIGYITMLLWLATWHFGEIILNHLVLIKAKGALSLYSVNSAGNITMNSTSVISNATLDYINMISSMYWMVPTISGLVIGGFSWMALSSMTGGITGRAAKGEAVAGEVGSGSWQIGNVRMNNTAANTRDTTSVYNSGQSFTNKGFGFQSDNMSSAIGINTNNTSTHIGGGTIIGNAAHKYQNLISNSVGGEDNARGYSVVAGAGNRAVVDGSGNTTENGQWTMQDKKGNTLMMEGSITSSKDGQLVSTNGLKITGKADNNGISENINDEVSISGGKLTRKSGNSNIIETIGEMTEDEQKNMRNLMKQITGKDVDQVSSNNTYKSVKDENGNTTMSAENMSVKFKDGSETIFNKPSFMVNKDGEVSSSGKIDFANKDSNGNSLGTGKLDVKNNTAIYQDQDSSVAKKVGNFSMENAEVTNLEKSIKNTMGAISENKMIPKISSEVQSVDAKSTMVKSSDGTITYNGTFKDANNNVITTGSDGLQVDKDGTILNAQGASFANPINKSTLEFNAKNGNITDFKYKDGQNYEAVGQIDQNGKANFNATLGGYKFNNIHQDDKGKWQFGTTVNANQGHDAITSWKVATTTAEKEAVKNALGTSYDDTKTYKVSYNKETLETTITNVGTNAGVGIGSSTAGVGIGSTTLGMNMGVNGAVQHGSNASSGNDTTDTTKNSFAISKEKSKSLDKAFDFSNVASDKSSNSSDKPLTDYMNKLVNDKKMSISEAMHYAADNPNDVVNGTMPDGYSSTKQSASGNINFINGNVANSMAGFSGNANKIMQTKGTNIQDAEKQFHKFDAKNNVTQASNNAISGSTKVVTDSVDSLKNNFKTSGDTGSISGIPQSYPNNNLQPAPNGGKIMEGIQKHANDNRGGDDKGGGHPRTYDPTQHTIDPIAINKFDATKIDAILGSGNKK